MKVLYYPAGNLFKPIDRAVVTVGVFDGLHKGHLILLKKTLCYSQRIKGKSVVITFWPHPQKEKLIYSLSWRLKLLQKLGIDFCIVINFNRRIREFSPERFIQDILLKITNPYYLIVGKNFHFGKGACGDVELLKKLSLRYGFKLRVVSPLKSNNKIISSTYIRNLILKGEIDEANFWLSFPFTISGTVIKGRGLGARLGFPTANLDIDNEIVPKAGVYIVKIRLSHKIFPALCYIGNRPTFYKNKNLSKKISLEIHILDFKRPLYGRSLEVEFIKRLRPQKRFLSPLRLVQAIKKDVSVARQIFSHSYLS